MKIKVSDLRQIIREVMENTRVSSSLTIDLDWLADKWNEWSGLTSKGAPLPGMEKMSGAGNMTAVRALLGDPEALKRSTPEEFEKDYPEAVEFVEKVKRLQWPSEEKEVKAALASIWFTPDSENILEKKYLESLEIEVPKPGTYVDPGVFSGHQEDWGSAVTQLVGYGSFRHATYMGSGKYAEHLRDLQRKEDEKKKKAAQLAKRRVAYVEKKKKAAV